MICVGCAVSHAVVRRAFTSALFLNLRRLPRSPTSCRSVSGIPDPGCTAAAPRFRLPAKGGDRFRGFLSAPSASVFARAARCFYKPCGSRYPAFVSFRTLRALYTRHGGRFRIPGASCATREGSAIPARRFPLPDERLSRRSFSVFRVCENRALIRQYFLNECYLLCLKNPAI